MSLASKKNCKTIIDRKGGLLAAFGLAADVVTFRVPPQVRTRKKVARVISPGSASQISKKLTIQAKENLSLDDIRVC